MADFKYPLATTTWDECEYRAMNEVIESRMFTMGPKVKAFESAFAEFIGSDYAVMVNSGSSANLLMVAALFFVKDNPLRPGDEVIVPAVSWSTTYYPLQQYGLHMRFVDIDLDTLNFDLDQLESAITDKTKLILAVNLLGNPNDFTRINKLITNRHIRLLEDNCESMGALFNDKMAGTFGTMGSFSCFFSHHISTMEGGVVVTENEELYHILLSLRAHGWTRDLPEQNSITGIKSDDQFEESFRFALPGYNLRPLELSGAIGLEQLKKLPSLVKERRKNGAYLQELMDDHPRLMIQKEIGASSWFGFSLVVKRGADIDRQYLINKLKNFGIEYRPIVGGNFIKNPVCSYFDYQIHQTLNNAEYIDKSGLFIGNQHYSIARVIDAIKTI